MGEVIAFPKPKSHPHWLPKLTALWRDEANWRATRSDERYFEPKGYRLLAIIHPYFVEDDYYWGYSFIVYGGHGVAVSGEFIWADPADAHDAAWEALVKAVVSPEDSEPKAEQRR
jgi:hypothetical protein